MIFKKRIYGKWILSGEHSVLRSQAAIAFPLKKYYIDFSYEETNEKIKINYTGEKELIFKMSFLKLFEQALKVVGKTLDDVKGTITINSHIPFGAGFGTSAILAVACSILFERKSWISKDDMIAVAKKIEDLSHKKSSGIDVVAVLEQKNILFQNGKVKKYLEGFKQQPHLYLSYCGKKCSTYFAVSQVMNLFSKRDQDLKRIDEVMLKSVNLCLESMEQDNEDQMKESLKEGLDLAEQCFQDLSLMSKELREHSETLKQAGALATKPTGSGLGGFVISLWDKKPEDSVSKKLSLTEVF